MHEGTCPSCGSSEIYAARNGIALGQTWSVGIRPHLEPGFTGIVRPHPTEGLWTYLCATCGLVEFRLLDAAAIDAARATWVRVPKPS